MQIEFPIENSHSCTSHIEGDWIIWRCPICIDYERRLNVVTGKMTVKGKTEFSHQGSNNGKSNINEPLTKNINYN
jgi:hypothetical protein